MAYGKSLWREMLDSGKLEAFSDEKDLKGNRRIIKGVYKLLYNENNEAIGHFGIQNDVTEDVEQKEALEDYKDKLSVALDAETEALWDWDIQEDSLTVTDSWLTMLGYSPQEVTPTFDFWERILHPDDASSVMTKLTDYLEGRIDSFHLEFRLRTQNGKYNWIMAHGKIVERDESGKPVRLIGTHTDITSIKELQLREKKHKELLQISLDAGGKGFGSGMFKPVIATLTTGGSACLGMNAET